MSRSLNVAANVPLSTASSSPSTWDAIYREVCLECDATRAAVLATQRSVHDAVLPRLDRVNASCDACDVTLRGILRGLRRSVDAPSQLAAADPLPEEHQRGSAELCGSMLTDAPEEDDMPPANATAPTSSRVTQLEERLSALARQVALQEKAFAREGQRQQGELQQVRRGVEQMEECKSQLLVVLRQLQLDKVALLRAFAVEGPQRAVNELSGSPPPLLPRSMRPGRDGVDGWDSTTTGDAPAAATLASFEHTVNGLQLLMRQEREAREAQVQELNLTLQKLESVVSARQRDHRLPAPATPPSHLLQRTPAIEKTWTANRASTQQSRDITPGSGARRGSDAVRGPKRELHYPDGGVNTPSSVSRRLPAAVGDADAVRAESAAHTRGAASLRDRLLRFYATYDPRMIPAVAEVVRQFKGPPEELLAALEMDYRAYGYFSRA